MNMYINVTYYTRTHTRIYIFIKVGTSSDAAGGEATRGTATP